MNSIHDSKEAMVRAALDIASLIAKKSPITVQGTKELLNWSRDYTIAESKESFGACTPVLACLVFDFYPSDRLMANECYHSEGLRYMAV